MAIVINGSGTITGVSAGGLPDGSVDSDTLATGIDATKLADGTVTSTELQYINTLASNAQTQISGATNTPAFAAYHTATIAVSAASATAITLGSEYFDTDSAYNVSDGKFTVPSGEDGKYWISGQYRVKDGDTNTRQVLSFNKNTVLIGQEIETRKAASTGYLGINHSVLVDLAAGDYVQLIVYIAGGGSQDTYDYSFYGFKLLG